MTKIKPEDMHIESTYDIEGTLFFGLWIDLHTNNKEKVADVKREILEALKLRDQHRFLFEQGCSIIDDGYLKELKDKAEKWDINEKNICNRV